MLPQMLRYDADPPALGDVAVLNEDVVALRLNGDGVELDRLFGLLAESGARKRAERDGGQQEKPV